MERVSSIALKPGQTAIKPTPELSMQKCLEWMVTLAEARRESLSKEGLKVYATCLAQYNPAHVKAVLTRLARTPREEFEKAIPELGELEAMVKQEEKASRPKFVACEKCDHTGIVFVNDKGEPWKDSIDFRKSEKFARECECKKAWRAL